ncbi:MAG: hypothetical protein JKY02_09620 [Flavobacteriaceae bacterium]|nr:hypothetical protein [Flavobacteriaceae bacterium]
MKRFSIIALFLSIGLVFTSCEENTNPIFDNVNGQTMSQFVGSSNTLGVNLDGSSFAEITVLVTTVSTSERTIDVVAGAGSTATAGQYSLSNLVIPAGSYEGTVRVEGDYSSLPSDNSAVSLEINLTGISGSGHVQNGTYTVSLFRFCPVVLANLVGSWSGDGSWWDIFGYTTEVVTSMNGADLLMHGLAFQWFEGWWGEVFVTTNAPIVTITSPDGDFEIAQQFYGTSTWNGSPQPPYDVKATGKFDSCTNSAVVYPILIQGGSEYNGANFGGTVFSEIITRD